MRVCGASWGAAPWDRAGRIDVCLQDLNFETFFDSLTAEWRYNGEDRLVILRNETRANIWTSGLDA